MGWTTLFYALALAAFILVGHILIWQIRRPKAQMKAVLLLFLGLSIVFCGILLLEHLGTISTWLPQLSLLDIGRVGFFLLAFSLAYFVAYSAIASDSPTILLNHVVDRAMPEGVPEDELAAHGFSMEAFYQSRLDQLLANSMVVKANGKYDLGAAGKRFLQGILWHRQFLDTPLEVED